MLSKKWQERGESIHYHTDHSHTVYSHTMHSHTAHYHIIQHFLTKHASKKKLQETHWSKQHKYQTISKYVGYSNIASLNKNPLMKIIWKLNQSYGRKWQEVL